MMPGAGKWTVPASFNEQEVTNMSKLWNEKKKQEAEKAEGSWDEDWQLPEGSGEILGEDWQEAEEEKGRRKEIGEDMVNLVIGGLADTCKTSTSTSTSKSSSQRKRKRDDILLPEI